MSVFYSLRENKMKTSKSKGQWFAQVVPLGTKTIEDMAKVIQRNCTVKRSDILAVLSEFGEVFATYLQDGYRVKVDGLGSFKVGVRSKGAIDPTEFKGEKNIKSAHINFKPEATWNKTAKKYTANALIGIDFQDITTRASEMEMAKRKESMDAAQTGGNG